MKKIIYFGLGFLSLLLLIACGKEEEKSSQQNQTSQPQQQTTVKQAAIGAEAPDFTLQSMDGKEVKLSDFNPMRYDRLRGDRTAAVCPKEVKRCTKTGADH